jgi:hypothetical protein
MTLLRLCLEFNAIIAQKDTRAKSRNASVRARVWSESEKLF